MAAIGRAGYPRGMQQPGLRSLDAA